MYSGFRADWESSFAHHHVPIFVYKVKYSVRKCKAGKAEERSGKVSNTIPKIETMFVMIT